MKGDGNYDRVEASDEGQRGDDDVEEGQSWNFSRSSVDEVNEHELKRWRGDERVERKKGRKETAWKKRMVSRNRLEISNRANTLFLKSKTNFYINAFETRDSWKSILF